MVDIATRVWTHKWKIDPIVRSLIDTDFYKLLMCQSVFRNRPDTQVQFSLINRTTAVPLADLIDEGDPSDFLHIVLSGSVELFSTWNGRETTMATVIPSRYDHIDPDDNLYYTPQELEDLYQAAKQTVVDAQLYLGVIQKQVQQDEDPYARLWRQYQILASLEDDHGWCARGLEHSILEHPPAATTIRRVLEAQEQQQSTL